MLGIKREYSAGQLAKTFVPRCFFEIAVLKNFQNFPGKHLCCCLFPLDL